jgi:hypothetical protein
VIPPTLIDSIEETLQHATDAPPEPEPGTPLHERLSVFVRLTKLSRELEEAAKNAKAKLALMEPSLALDMAAAGMTSANFHGMNVHFKTKSWCNKKSEEDGVTTQMICDALVALGRPDMVKDGYSPSSLGSLVKEYLDGGEEVPEALKPLINYGSNQVLSVVKGSR